MKRKRERREGRDGERGEEKEVEEEVAEEKEEGRMIIYMVWKIRQLIRLQVLLLVTFPQ